MAGKQQATPASH